MLPGNANLCPSGTSVIVHSAAILSRLASAQVARQNTTSTAYLHMLVVRMVVRSASFGNGNELCEGRRDGKLVKKAVYSGGVLHAQIETMRAPLAQIKAFCL